jgi:hypothetical protein
MPPLPFTLLMATALAVPTDVPPAEMDAYRAALARAGSSADTHVRLANWCEARGLDAERAARLADALRISPNHRLAHALLGEVQVRVGSAWVRAADLPGRPADPRLAPAREEYERRRAQLDGTATGHLALAAWCAAHGLAAEAHTHALVALRIDPANPEAHKRLHHKFTEGRWVDPAAAARARNEQSEAKTAYRGYLARLVQVAHDLGIPDRRAKATVWIDALRDPLAAPAVWDEFVAKGARSHRLATQLLTQLDGRSASLRLALLATMNTDAAVRATATDALLRRDPREFVGPIIGLIQPTVNFTVKQIGGPGDPGQILIDGWPMRVYPIPTREEFRTAASPGTPSPLLSTGLPTQPGSSTAQLYGNNPEVASALRQAIATPTLAPRVLADAVRRIQEKPASPTTGQVNVAPAQARDDQDEENRRRKEKEEEDHERKEKEEQELYEKAVEAIRKQFADDVTWLKLYNAEVARVRGWVLELLEKTTGQSLGERQESWAQWWLAWVEPDAAAAPPREGAPADRPPLPHRSRLAGGTRVLTPAGPRPVEDLRPGDRVLGHDPRTGELDVHPVVAATGAAGDAVLRVRLDGGAVVMATALQRFWVCGRGWVMAQDLRAGDLVRALGGAARVGTVEPAGKLPTYQIEVAEAPTLLVTDRGLLAHDHTLAVPVARPFDVPAELASRPASPAKAAAR